ncbi:hypothetical protein FJY63_02245 [Candidatus Sumerlaeota bacterium]|nr:hypothetical protein [Candidatus Sumerlaeota bacterium]
MKTISKEQTVQSRRKKSPVRAPVKTRKFRKPPARGLDQARGLALELDKGYARIRKWILQACREMAKLSDAVPERESIRRHFFEMGLSLLKYSREMAGAELDCKALDAFFRTMEAQQEPESSPAPKQEHASALADRSQWSPKLRKLIEDLFPEEEREERIRRATERPLPTLGRDLPIELVRYYAEDVDFEYDV